MTHHHLQESVIEAGIAVSNKTTVAGAAAGVLGWAVQVNWIGIAGLGIALLGFMVNFYFQARRDRREAAESAARIAALRDRCNLS